ncbi:MAG TPA: RIO1 family regulatory kinase/ATPase, partial [Methanomassiliicoccales archaeon]|nr:RIO1 family regulatory kinase/ATPase [Methanomassiliicoccales archaeon]
IAAEDFGMSQVSVHPLGSGGSRLSIPVRISGRDKKGNRVKLFGKILGNADIMTARTIQTAKNLYLNMSAHDPMFDFARDTGDMARHQCDTMKVIYDLGIPTAKPYGCYQLNDILWLLIYEFLDAKPVTDIGRMSLEQMDEVFGWLKLMHKNGIYHGDIKPDNVMLGKDKLYILDVGRYLEEAPPSQKQAYDLACQIASFLQFQPAEDIVMVARKHYSKEELREASEYLELIQRRIDIKFSDETKKELLRLMQ